MKDSKKAKGPAIGNGSLEARKLAAAILEVLGGLRLPTDAAKALGISLPRYYQLESRALSGLLSACEPRQKGRVRSVENELDTLRKELARSQREAARYAALARIAQRTVGLPAPQPVKREPGKRRTKKPTVRALRAVDVIKSMSSGETSAGSAGEQPA
ncbi:MAG: hypothetical protein HC834_06230 [Rhodospirillales bacterium]|nr:hypothetical protein [Rhodospirillales bacterium]